MPLKNNCDYSQPSRFFLSFLFLEIVFLTFLAGTYAAESHRYAEKTGAQTTFFLWQLDMDTNETVIITSLDEDVRYVNVCDSTGATHKWRMLGKNSKVTAQRKGNELHITGMKDGEKIDARITLDDAPWFQPLSYSLRNLIREKNDKQTTFWMIRPDTLEPQKFQANRAEEGKIYLESRAFQAVRVTICPAGLLSCFWHATYWFRVCDGLFLRYEGTHGPPGTPKTIISHDPPPADCS